MKNRVFMIIFGAIDITIIALLGMPERIVAAKAAILAEGDAAERKDIIFFLEQLPLFEEKN